MTNKLSTKNGAVALALGTVIALIVLKVIVAFLTDSISITAQAADSALDLFSIGVIFLAVRAASKPEDEDHPFGHGKMEGIAAIIQGLLIIAAAYFITHSAIMRIIDKTIMDPSWSGIGVMLTSVVSSILLSRHLKKVANSTDSTAIEALANNINADIFSTSGVLAGLLIVRLTGLQILDPVIALVMVVLILKAGFQVIRRSFHELTDYRLPKEEQAILLKIMDEHKNSFAGFHEVRSRRAGSQRFVDLHLVMPRYASVEEAHEMCDHLENDIKEKLANASVVIHVEPCADEECQQCLVISCEMNPGK
ncbi:MAG: cation diffusion facilitator family transporter [Dehalococcoidales bacterium]|nr:cation diffusion facilitator family transporter [Dehalococcoidales bacterium]